MMTPGKIWWTHFSWQFGLLTIWIYFCSRSTCCIPVYSWWAQVSRQQPSICWLAWNSLKRDILLCRLTKVLATNLIFIRLVWMLIPSHKRIINTTFFGNLNNFFVTFYGEREHRTQLNTKIEIVWRHHIIYRDGFLTDLFSNVMRRNWILIALMGLGARVQPQLCSILYI